ncbi:alkaline phosphatase [Saccharobesus litoralis]|uniref:Alkaline phosphatase n=1 Tax=Saccharobesus litoralis TaxID=2172099 RepID=A0A2S0VUV0_9ALTE|nr:choice-of-anchor I family protein [Saccharobesus litoralis]AWB67975.1 alkaline phosphatase [Saccharobesus litoralis]
MKKANFKLTALAAVLASLATGCGLIDDSDDNENVAAKPVAIEMELVGRAVLNVQDPEGAAEIVQYQKSTGYIYAVNSSTDDVTVEIIDANNIDKSALTKNGEGVVTNTNLTVMSTIKVSDNTAGDANSIAISDERELLAVAMAADAVDANGYIAFYDISGAQPVFLKNVEVGVLPDMVTFSPDGNKVVVANEGEPAGNYMIDPEGTISIIDISGSTAADISAATTLDFKAYNGKQAELEAKGVRFAHPKAGAITINGVSNTESTVAQDLEPEYVAVTADSKKAYVAMQENNAFAVVDLQSKTITDILGLGFKDWGMYELDASDKDDKVNFSSYPNLYGMYQPDTIVSYTANGQNYIVSANEGDGREYFFDVADEQACNDAIDETKAPYADYDEDDGCLSYLDESRVEDLTLDATAFAGVQNDDSDLGRLKVSVEYGDTDNDGEYEELYTYGARSFTIWNEQGQVVFDSGDDVGKITHQIHGEAFNNDEDENEGDTRSDAKGAEPEALAIGVVAGRTLAFVGLERMGGVLVYDITDPANAEYLTYFYNRGVVEGADITGDLAPEGMKFIPATDSKPAMLVIGNEISGSVAVWQITATEK